MNKSQNILIPLAIIFFTVMSRFINVEYHFWANLAPLAAVSLFSGYAIKDKRLAMAFPLITYLLSDIMLSLFTKVPGFYGISQLFVYGAMLLIVWLGGKMKNVQVQNVIGFSLGGSAIFWIVSNFGVWFSNLFLPAGERFYSADLAGLGSAYYMALPFYNAFAKEAFIGTFAGDLVYNVILFAVYAYICSKMLRKAKV